MSFQNCKIVGRQVDPAKYHQSVAQRGAKDFIVSSSSLRDACWCMAKWILGHEKAETFAMAYGQLLDCLVLTPHMMAERFQVRPTSYEKHVLKCPQCGSITSAKKCQSCKVDRVEATIEAEWTLMSDTCKEAEENWKKAGKLIFDKDGNDKFPGFNQAADAAKRLTTHLECGAFIRDSDAQVHVAGEWLDKATGLVIPCQCLIDMVPRTPPPDGFADSLGDLKSARTAFPPFFTEDVRSRGYQIQAAWNLDMFNAATGEKRDRFCLLVSENTHPWQAEAYFMAEATDMSTEPGMIDYGRVIYQAMMARYAHCLAENKWPGYGDGWTEIKPNPYKDNPAQERAIEAAPAPVMDKAEQESEDLIPWNTMNP